MGKIVSYSSSTTLISKVKAFFSDKKFSFFVLTLVILVRLLQLLYFFNTRNDMTYQILAVQNFYEGHGMSSIKILPSDLSTVIYEPQNKWPPGFSILFIPFYVLFGKNYLPAALTISILSALVLVFFCRRILKIVNIPLYQINLFTLLTGFSIYYFYNKPCTDSTAITFFVIGFYFALLLLKADPHFFRNLAGMITALFLCAFLKYQYIPVVFTIPFFLLLKGFSGSNLTLKKSGYISFFVLAFSLFVLLAYQKFTSGSVAYIRQTERGLFLPNLLSAHPFLPASFVKPESLALFFTFSPQTNSIILGSFKITHLILFLLLTIYGIRKLARNDFSQKHLAGDFFYLFLIISLAITLLLTLLSLRVTPEKEDGIIWTYLQEPRYYGLINVLIHLGVFVTYQCSCLKNSRLLKYLFFLFLLAMLPEVFRGLIFTSRRVFQFSKEKYGWVYEYEIQQYAEEIFKIEQAKQPQLIPVLAGSSDWMTLRVSLYSQIPIFNNVSQINNLSLINTRKPVLLLVVLRNSDLESFQPYLSSKENQFIGSKSGFSFYRSYLFPH